MPKSGEKSQGGPYTTSSSRLERPAPSQKANHIRLRSLAGSTCCILSGHAEKFALSCRRRRRPRPLEGQLRPWSNECGAYRQNPRRRSWKCVAARHVDRRSTILTNLPRKSAPYRARRHASGFARTALPAVARAKVLRLQRGCRVASTAAGRCSWSRSVLEFGSRAESSAR